MFHINRDCAACEPLLFPTVKIESVCALESEGIYATIQDNSATINEDNQDDFQDD